MTFKRISWKFMTKAKEIAPALLIAGIDTFFWNFMTMTKSKEVRTALLDHA